MLSNTITNTATSETLWQQNHQITLASIPKEVAHRLKDLGHRKLFYDYATIIFTWTLFIVLFCTSKFFYANTFTAILFILLQGFVVHTIAELIHEYHVHSNTKYSMFCYVTALLIPFSPTLYRKIHYRHHQYFPNEPGDPDIITNKVTGILEKVLCFTALNYLIMKPQRDKRFNFPYKSVAFSAKETFRIKIEKNLCYLAIILAIIAYFFGFKEAVLGWMIPLLVGMPIFTGFRVFAEHSELDNTLPFGCGTNIRIPFLFRFTPYAKLIGEGHILHHYYPNIPWYNCNKACSLLRQYMPSNINHRSFKAFSLWLQNKL